MENLVDELNIGILILDEEKNVVYCNRWIVNHCDKEHYLNLSKSDNFYHLFPEASNTRLETAIESALEYGVPSHLSHSFGDSYLQFFPRDKAGVKRQDPLVLSFRVGPVEYNDQHCCLLQIFDQTDVANRDASLVKLGDELKVFNASLEKKVANRTEEMRKAKNEAEKASNAKSIFLASMSHELRTPMNGVIGILDVLSETTSLNEDQKNLLSVARDSAFALLRIINDVLDFSKVEAGKTDMLKVPFDALEALDGVIKILSSSAKDRNNKLTYEVASPVPREIVGDPDRFRQILLNIIGNAVKFTSGSATKPGNIHVKIFTEQEQVRPSDPEGVDIAQEKLCVIVSDTGIGMSKEEQDRVFFPFLQADTGISRRFGGTGLGLTITKELLRLMGGDIALESRKNIGSKFKIRIPVGVTSNDRVGEKVFSGLVVLVMDSLEECQCLEHSLNNLQVKTQCIARERAMEYFKKELKPKDEKIRLVIESGTDDVAFEKLVQSSGVIKGNVAIIPNDDDFMQDAWIGYKHLDGSAIGYGELLTWFVHKDQKEILVNTQEQKVKFNLKALLVEDNPINQMVIRRQLESLGMSIDTALDGKEGLECYKHNKYDVIFCDCHMPIMDGYEMTKIIRDYEAKNSTEHIFIIAITANALMGSVDECLMAGMDGYLSKPLRMEDIENKVLSIFPKEKIGF